MTAEKIQHEARKFALQNAVQFNGKANEKAVAGKVIAALKKDGISPAQIVPLVSKVVSEVNSMPFVVKFSFTPCCFAASTIPSKYGVSKGSPLTDG